MKRAVLTTISARLKVLDAERVQITVIDTDTGEIAQLVWNWRIDNPKSNCKNTADKNISVENDETEASD